MASDHSSVTDEAGCPECGHAAPDVFQETKAEGWNADELLISAHLDVEIYAFRTKGVSMGWLKDEIDRLLLALAREGLESTAKLSGAPVSEYTWIAETIEDTMGEDIKNGSSCPNVADKVSDFLNRLRGRRAGLAKEALITWDEGEHLN
tara:strand:- start:137 stop:583 length:447 start_codon:yes stop_codon:yes gene_type:complete